MKVEAVTCSDRRFVYLLVNSEGTAFKIGVSQNTHARISAIPVDIDYLRSFEISMETGAAYSVEKVLHYMFRNHRYSMPRGDGYTEWFDISIFDEVVRFLNEQRARLGVGDMQQLSSPTLPHLNVARTKISADVLLEVKNARLQARLKAKAERYEAAGLWNAQVYSNTKLFLEEMHVDGVLAGVIFGDVHKPSADTGSGRAEGYLILEQPNLEKWLDRVDDVMRDPNGWNLLAGNGAPKVFCGYCYGHSDPIVAMNIPMLSAYTADDGALTGWRTPWSTDNDDEVPCIDAIRKLFLAYLLEPGTSRFDEMQHRHTELEAAHAVRRSKRANDN